MPGTAADTYRIEVLEPSRRSRIARLVGALTLGVLTMGAGPTNAGGRRVTIVDRGRGQTVAEWPEPAADEAHELHGRISSDLDSLDAEAFEERWIPG